jgi:hypothetical protein
MCVSGCRRGRTPERSLRQPPTSFRVSRSVARADRPGLLFCADSRVTTTLRLVVARQRSLLYGCRGSYPVRYFRPGYALRNGNNAHPMGAQNNVARSDRHLGFSRPLGAGGPLPPRTPTRGGPADPHLPGFRLFCASHSRFRALTQLFLAGLHVNVRSCRSARVATCANRKCVEQS